MALFSLNNQVYNEKGELQYGGANAPAGTSVTGVGSLDEISGIVSKYKSLGLDPSQENRALIDQESAKRNEIAGKLESAGYKAQGNDNFQKAIDAVAGGASIESAIQSTGQPAVNPQNKLPTETFEQWQQRIGQTKLLEEANKPKPPTEPAIEPYTFGKQLDFGTTGEDVKKLQQFLNRAGFSVAAAGQPGSAGFETNFFGPATQAALKKFQASQGIETEGDAKTTGFGRVGPKTLAKLNELYGLPPTDIVSKGVDSLAGGVKTATTTTPASGTGAGTGTPTGGAGAGTPGAGGADPNKASRDAAAAAANDVANNIFNSIKDGDIDTRESSKLLEGLKDKIDDPEPVKPNLTQIFADEKKKLGLDILETKISEIDSEIEAINTTLLTEADKAGERLVSTREIGRRKGKLQTAAEREIALLQVEKNALSRQASNKLDTIKLTMDIASTDFQIASDTYNNSYKKAVDMYNLVAGAEDRDLSAAGRIKDDARANLTVLQNVIKSGNLEYDKLSAEQKQKIKQLELEAGYPAGITESITRVIGKAEVLFTEKSYDENGREIVTVAYKDSTTGKFSSKEVIQTGGTKPKELFTDSVHRALAGAGLSEEQIDHIEDGIVNFGLDEVIAGENLTPEQEEALRGGLTGSKDSKLITATAIQTTSVNAKQEDVENTLRGTYTDAELSDLADEAGFSAWFDLAPQEIKNYLKSPAARKKYAEILRGQYESAGYKITD